MVRRARALAVRAKYLEGLVVTPIARDQVDRTAAKRNGGRGKRTLVVVQFVFVLLLLGWKPYVAVKPTQPIRCTCIQLREMHALTWLHLLEATCRSVVSAGS